MTKICIYGGSFSPIHLGHTALAEFVLNNTDVDEVWLVVSPKNPLKDANKIWNDNLRLVLAKEATKNNPRIKVCDVEMQLPKPSYTINTLNYLKKQFPDNKFSLLIGADNMQVFDKWKSYEEIISNYQIYVYPRQGSDTDKLKQKYPSMIVLDNAPLLPISASDIRQKISNGKSVKGLIHDDTARLLKSYMHDKSALL